MHAEAARLVGSRLACTPACLIVWQPGPFRCSHLKCELPRQHDGPNRAAVILAQVVGQ